MKYQNGLCSPGEPEAIFDAAMLGEWVAPEAPKGMEGYYKVERDSPASKAYRVTLVSTGDDGKPSGKPYIIKAYLVKFGKSFFLDAVCPPEPGEREGSPSHFILRVETKMPEMTVRSLNEEFVKEHPDEIRRTVKKSPLGFESETVTATTQELSLFVRDHAHDGRAWKEQGLVLRHR